MEPHLLTEQPSGYTQLDQLTPAQILAILNEEDQTVPRAVEKALPQIGALVEAFLPRMKAGGRLFYIGAGTSGRLGIVDASECPPTFGVPHGLVVGLIAGGDTAIRKAVEFAEDDEQAAWADLSAHHIGENDVVIGIAASGRTPYVLGGLKACRERHILTGCITCNPGTALAALAHFPVEVITGPEVITGSTRMKAGTAQKLVLNMISSTLMIGLGRVKGNKMVDMQLSNLKLVDRGERMLMDELGIGRQQAAELLARHGSVRAAAHAWQQAND